MCSHHAARTDEIPSYVLDTYAYIAFVRHQAAAGAVQSLLDDADRGRVLLHMSAANVGEVLYTVWRKDGEYTARRVVDRLLALPVQVHEPSLAEALAAGAIKARHRLFYADCFAAALAQQLGATLVTGDPEFAALEPEVKIMWIGP